MLVVAGYESRSETETAFTLSTFASGRMNVIAAVEAVGAALITQWDFMNRLLGTQRLTAQQWGLALLSAVVLFLVWEAAKWVARRASARPATPVLVPAPTA